MIIHDVKQGTEEWLKLRRGKITGSRLKDVMKADNLSLIDELIAERISDEVEENYVNEAMRRGTEQEPFARRWYEDRTGIKIIQHGFLQSKKYPFLGHSPDGIQYNAEGKPVKGIEIKCPNTSTHVKYIRMGKFPNEYKYQGINFFIVNPELESLDFISFDDRFSVQPMFVKTITREEWKEEIEKAIFEVEKFWVKFESYYNDIIF